MMRSCPICQLSDTKIIAAYESVNIIKCRICTVVYADKSPNIRNMEEDYYSPLQLKKYFDYYEGFRRKHSQIILKKLSNYKTGLDLLDVGCSFGWFLDEASKIGYQSHGIENSKMALSYIQSKSNIHIMSDSLENANTDHKTFDVVTILNVLEHLPNPTQSLEIIRNKLKKTGTLVIAVPNRHGLFHQLSFLAHSVTFGRIKSQLDILFQFDNDFYHRFCFSLKNIKDLLNRSGFKLISYYKGPAFDPKNIGKRKAINKNTNEMSWLDSYLTKYLFYVIGPPVSGNGDER